ncbi:unnamed protein product [Chondrus crispus]|uniref:Uncharacterized protein n=1 Tax=Chondrus crispus TaxID=2769 RepID=R7QAG7_CHOCR|nr:unnamed protein product [Chondrus crispus]CDF34455.1 unnamed protein product [Chondrus crispus]|eukprot:XP_005714274.1 unnamed protein product [Chondrus crispus]
MEPNHSIRSYPASSILVRECAPEGQDTGAIIGLTPASKFTFRNLLVGLIDGGWPVRIGRITTKDKLTQLEREVFVRIDFVGTLLWSHG